MPEQVLIKVISSEEEMVREVYATFGLAMFVAQTLERQLQMILTYEGLPAGASYRDCEALLAAHYENTFGGLTTKLLELPLGMSPELSARVRLATERRNALAHTYYWDRAIEIMSADGQAQMIHELRQWTEEFGSLEHELSAFFDQALAKHGVQRSRCDETVQRLAKEMTTAGTTRKMIQRECPNV